MIWQGWLASVSPLITGTEECSAISCSVAGSKVRIITMSTKRDSTRAVSAMVSPWPSCISPPESTIVSPPSCRTPTSKLTRVRVEGFSKIERHHPPGQRQLGVRRAARQARARRLHRAGGVEDRPELRRRRGVEVEEVPHAAASSATAAASSRRSPSSASASLRFRAGRSRATFSAAGTTSTRAS